MSDTRSADRAQTVSLGLGLLLVAIGMLNTMPSIPGLDAGAEALGGPGFVIRKFSYEYLFPLVFVVMMATVACRHAFRRAAAGRGPAVRGLALAAVRAGIVMFVIPSSSPSTRRSC